MELNELTQTSGEWLRGNGPEADIVISSRIRLARNLAEFPFISRATPQDRVQIERLLRDCMLSINTSGDLLYIAVDELEGVDRQLLVERHLISREHAEGQGRRAVAIDKRREIQPHDQRGRPPADPGHAERPQPATASGSRSTASTTLIEEKVTYAFHERLGYLTACPTNVGTGMRVSVMLHLPALVITRQIEKVFRSLQKISLAVRGLYGEGSQAMGDFYQISNQITLGRSEDELVQQVSDIVPVIIDYERQARQFLIKESQENLHDRVSRAYGILRTAQTISSEETMHLLSSVRMGVNLGLIHDLQIADINELFIHTQPAHLQKMTGGELGTRRPQHRAGPLPPPLPQQRERGAPGGEELRRGVRNAGACNGLTSPRAIC